MTIDVGHLVAECKKIEENCLYTGQTHFAMAASSGRKVKVWLMLIPSIIGAGSGLAVALGAPTWIGAFAAFTGIVTSVATFLGIDRESIAHETAGKLLTQLRDETRALREAYSPNMTPEQFATDVRALGNRYRAFVASLPLTSDDAFEKARKKVKDGVFQFDSDAQQPPAVQGPTTPSLPAGSPPGKK